MFSEEFREWDRRLTEKIAPFIGFTLLGCFLLSFASAPFFDEFNPFIGIIGGPIAGLIIYGITRNRRVRIYLILLFVAFMAWIAVGIVTSIIWAVLDLPINAVTSVVRFVVLPVLVAAIVFALSGLRSTLYTWLGRLYVTNGLPDEALNAFSKAIESNPRNAKVLLYRSALYRETDDLDRELVDLESAFAQVNSPELKYTALLVKSSNRVLAGQYEEAVEATSEAFAFGNNYQKAIALAQRAQARIVLGEYEEAISDLNEAFPMLPLREQPGAYYHLGVVRFMQQNYEEAQKHFETSFSHNSRDFLSQCGIAAVRLIQPLKSSERR